MRICGNGLEDTKKMKGQKLRQGYTTGTCAQAASKAAMQMLFSGKKLECVQVRLPEGRVLFLDITDIRFIYEGDGSLPACVSCAVKKDSGDDPDITDGVLVYSKVSHIKENKIIIDGGEGIGRVTKPGLDQPVGQAAINKVPRQMIEKEVKEVLEETGAAGGIRVEISIPEGERLAAKTFNPRLGIEGGLSVLGTSGIVQPMSEQALLGTIRAQIRVKIAEGNDHLIIAPGNYGLEFLKNEYGIEETEVVKCSNYIGQTLDMAQELGCGKILLAGHVGKLVKVSGGIMNTHSKWADCRMELLAAAALRAGFPGEKAGALLDCVTVDDALGKCTEKERNAVMAQVMEAIEKHLSHRVGNDICLEVIVFSNVYGILGKTKGADEFRGAGKGQK